MKPLPDKLAEDALGEIFVQLKFLQYGVQAAPPIKDSGNDLIAIKGEAFRSIQVKQLSLLKNSAWMRYPPCLAVMDTSALQGCVR